MAIEAFSINSALKQGAALANASIQSIQSAISDPNIPQAVQVAAQNLTPISPGELNTLLRQIASDISLLRQSLAPIRQWTPISQANLPVGSSYFQPLQGSQYNCMIGTVVGSLAQVNVYLGPADGSVMIPDFSFNSGFPSTPIFFPAMSPTGLTVVSAGSNPATFKIFLGSY